MTTAVLTPFSRSPAQQAGGMWRKRLLPVGSIDYQGRKITFDRGYNDALAQAFRAGAYDQVPLQFADAANTHTNDPERFRGEVTAMDSRDDGLWVTVRATPDGSQALAQNPRLGISARIVEDYARSDGKRFPVAIQHVLGTLDPRIPGLGAWEAIEASNTVDRTIDLTAGTIPGDDDGGRSTMPELNTEQQARLARLLEIPEDRFNQLVSGGAIPPLTDAETAALGGDDDQLTDEELAELAEAAWQLDQQGLLEGEPVAAGLSNETAAAIEMANYRADEAERQIGEFRTHLDTERFKAERDQLARDFGVPPFITNLAQPLLEGTGHVVDLANGTHVDAGQVMRTVLHEVGRIAGMLDLGIELGTPMDAPEAHAEEATRRGEIVQAYRTQTGI